MKNTLFFVLVVALAAASGQTINTEKSDRSKVIRVQTLRNHLSIIELAEPVTEVAAGSSSYKVECRGNKVFVQPLEPDATTNLFIWTASGRLNYELVPVSAAAGAEFAIDQEPGKAATSPPAVDPIAAKLASQMLFASSPVRLSGELKPARVHVLIKDVYRSENKAPKSTGILSLSDIRFDFPPDSRGGDVKAFLVF
jgi:hypothetical protein